MKYTQYIVCILALAAISCQPSGQSGLRTAPPGDYDLVAESVTFVPSEVQVGDPVVFTMVARNEGTDAIPARTYSVNFYIDGKRVSFDYATPHLIPGGSVSYSMVRGLHHFRPSKPGIYHYRFILDEEKNLPERTKDNNMIEGTITVTDAADPDEDEE